MSADFRSPFGAGSSEVEPTPAIAQVVPLSTTEQARLPVLPFGYAANAGRPLDAVATAECLVAAHPEANVSRSEVLDTLVFVASDAGVTTVVEAK